MRAGEDPESTPAVVVIQIQNQNQNQNRNQLSWAPFSILRQVQQKDLVLLSSILCEEKVKAAYKGSRQDERERTPSPDFYARGLDAQHEAQGRRAYDQSGGFSGSNEGKTKGVRRRFHGEGDGDTRRWKASRVAIS